MSFRLAISLSLSACVALVAPSALADDTAAPAAAAAPHKDSVQTTRRATPMLGFAAESQAVPSRPFSDRPNASKKETGERHDDFRIGAIAGVGFPRPFAVEGLVKIKDWVAIGGEYSFLPDMTISGADVNFKAVAGDLRVFPFQGGFFVGARVGRQWLQGRTTVTVSQLSTSFRESANADTFFINPRLGYLKTWNNGLTLGIDAGVQIPINPNYQRSSDAAKIGFADEGTDKTLVTISNWLGNRVTPSVDLLRLGFLF